MAVIRVQTLMEAGWKRTVGIVVLAAAVGVLAAAGAPRPTANCADTVAAAFAYHETVDPGASWSAILHGRWNLVKQRRLGSGAWACMAPLTRQELAARFDVAGDDRLARVIHTQVPAYTEVHRLGDLPQPGGDRTYVYALSLAVTTHVLVTDDGLLDRVRDHFVGERPLAHLKEVVGSRSALLLVHLDENGRVDRFGFVGDTDS